MADENPAKPPHQVNLTLWVNEGRDTDAVDSLNEVLRELGADGTLDDSDDTGWSWLGVKGLGEGPHR